MNSYRSHIVDILVENICLSKSALFLHRGIKNKKEFTKDLNHLIAEKRIRYEGDITGKAKEVLSPKVLKLAEYENRCGVHTRTFTINYAPTDVLEKVLEYVKPGTDPFEDNLDFHLQIMGYKLEEKYKSFFEEENGLTLDYTKFHYDLWAEYLFPKHQDTEPPMALKIIYADDDVAFAEKFMNMMKEQYVPDSTWYHFANCEDAISFYENSLHDLITLQLIIIGNNDEKKAIDCIMSLQKIASEFEALFIKYKIPVVVLTNDAYQINFRDKKFTDSWSYFQYPRNEDTYILGNSLKNIVHTPYYHTIIPTVFWH